LPRYVWLERGAVEAFTVAIRKSDGRRIERRVPARTREEFEAAEAKQAPAFALDWNAREARLLGDGIGYLRPGPFYDNRPEAAHPWDPGAFRAFVDDAFRKFIQAGVHDLIIDLRDNPGGDNSFSDPLVAWFATQPFRFAEAFDIRISEATTASNAKRLDANADSISSQLAALYARHPPGERVRFEIPRVPPRQGERYEERVHVLVNRHSYSNSVMVAAIVQDFGFGRILGEETADLASTYGAMESFALPRTGIVVGYPKARILRPSGDARPRGVIPDIAIATPLGAHEKDIVLEQALTIIREQRKT
jgi:C-terminal processing protease CtpA/Prc